MNAASTAQQHVRNMRIVIARHGNTEKAEKDLDRKLSETGVGQAYGLGTRVGRHFDLVVSSCALRANQTARLATGCESEPVVLNILYRPESDSDWEILNKMFEELRYASLRTYLQHPQHEVLLDFGQEMLDAFLFALEDQEVSEHSDVLVVSHAVFANLLLYFLTEDETVRNYALDSTLGECGYLDVTFGETPDAAIVEVG